MAEYTTIASDKSKSMSMILCAIGFLGVGGLHDFYLGKIGKGIIKLITLNWFMIGTIVDLIKLSTGQYTDNTGQPVRK